MAFDLCSITFLDHAYKLIGTGKVLEKRLEDIPMQAIIDNKCQKHFWFNGLQQHGLKNMLAYTNPFHIFIFLCVSQMPIANVLANMQFHGFAVNLLKSFVLELFGCLLVECRLFLYLYSI